MSKEMIEALDTLERERNIKKEIIIEALEASLISAYRRHYGQVENITVKFDDKKGDMNVFEIKKVVKKVTDNQSEISLKDAQKINKSYELDDEIQIQVTPEDFGRIAAQTAKQVIMQRVREAERNLVYDKYIQYENKVLVGEVVHKDNRYVYISLGDVEAVMDKINQIPGEKYLPHDKIKVYVTKVTNGGKGSQIFVSRTAEGLLRELFKQEIPEVDDGTIEIVDVAREAGARAKVSVRTTNPDVDPVGACVGPRGQRVQVIYNELNGENMDIVRWVEDPGQYVVNALNPAEVEDVLFDEDAENDCMVVVPDDQLSLAIGKRGQNARLSAKLTGYKIDIKSETEATKFFEEFEE